MIKAIIFDFDGTITDTFPIILKNANKLSKAIGLKEIKYYPEMRDKSAKQFFKEEIGISLWKVPKYMKKLKKLIKPELEKAKVFKGIKQLIDKLSKQYKIGILTTNSEDVVKKILHENKINSVDFIFSDSSVFGKHKKLKKLMRKHKLKNDKLIYVGDEIRDIEACKKKQVKVIAVSWGYNSKKALQQHEPDYLAEKPSKILEIFIKAKIFN